ncbi:MAG: membrane protein insertion efficiency factor YidD [Deltaproteobacteria bacterium]|jgi:putative membrane protein insertion efficiency factor|nr:membrane protein insertion efficiency factor YidD [Deltaproteobacteria bacterium]
MPELAVTLAAHPGRLRQVAVWPIRLYQMMLSPVLGSNCRHYPTCSAYATEAVLMHGVWRGGWLAFKRIVRCHPWSAGGFDPVPPSVHSPHSLQEHPGRHGK